MGKQIRPAPHVSTQQLWAALQRERDELVREKLETDLCERIHAGLKGKLRGRANDVDSALYEALYSLLRKPQLYDAEWGEVAAYVFGAARRILARRRRELPAASFKSDYAFLSTVSEESSATVQSQSEHLLDAARELALHALTRKEREIYELWCAGFTPREIRARLHRLGGRRRPSVRSVRSMTSRTTRKVANLLREAAPNVSLGPLLDRE